MHSVNGKDSRNLIWLALVGVLIAAASIVSLYTSSRTEVDSHRRALLGRGQPILDALRAGILAHGRMGRYRGDRLAIILEELSRPPDVIALELRDPDGKVLCSGGQASEIPKDLPLEPRWDSTRLVMTSRVDFRAEYGAGEQGLGRGRADRENTEDWLAFREGFYVLIAVLDVSDVHRAIRRHQFQLAMSTGITFAALGLGAMAILLMSKRVELTAALEREREGARRQKQVARLGEGLAHETKNPLGIVRGLAQGITDCLHQSCPVRAKAKCIVDEVDRVVGGIDSFLALARPEEAVPMLLELDPFFKDSLSLMQMDASAADVAVLYAPCGLSIRADEALLRRALLNLILNALRASAPGQSVRIDALRAGTTLSLRVSDAGCGIAPEDLPRVTEPYFTRFAGGSGLGLSIVEQIAAAHGWSFHIVSVVGQGTQASLDGIAIVESP